jgi:hypothetical protein
MTMAAPLKATVLYDYASADATHLAFEAGATIDVLRDQAPWALGRLGGNTGWFPSSYAKQHASPLCPPPLLAGGPAGGGMGGDLGPLGPPRVGTGGALGDLAALGAFGGLSAPMQPMGAQQQRAQSTSAGLGVVVSR